MTTTTPLAPPSLMPSHADAPCEVREAAPQLALGPGPLRSGSWIDLQTLQAQRLVRGRKPGDGQSRIVGLAGFGMRLRTLWTAALADDPWADWWLLRVHAALEKADVALDALVMEADGILARPAGVWLDRAHSVQPQRVPLAFSNPYGYRGGYLLAKFDDMTRAVLTAEHVALLDRSTGRRMIQEGGTHVRRAFLAADGYQRLGVTRRDVRAGAAAASEARSRMGEVPVEILEGRLRALFAPRRDRESRP